MHDFKLCFLNSQYCMTISHCKIYLNRREVSIEKKNESLPHPFVYLYMSIPLFSLELNFRVLSAITGL